jgi:hypothetical protein
LNVGVFLACTIESLLRLVGDRQIKLPSTWISRHLG